MTVTIAIAGKPNAGKSTFFKAATLADVEIASYPFTTISPMSVLHMCVYHAPVKSYCMMVAVEIASVVFGSFP